ncbi:maleylacetoacetate isomerase [Glaciecola sp. KUL10]|jgi:maleylacetoacetate isomerase|uniref:maleylacetoacetate isomerase n=1 Tax=Glaciecola sp. (strain KUL10) TaxID=2161813 RepID=UPI000D7880F0|nr:maleylacetoacetate isomerase [Glaciecola sp. KUL10]GBL03978.1 maleylacetoacetate isomerase [Glaciecola sp. KUL10]
MSLTLHGYWRSSATYRVRIAMNLKGLSYDYQPVHLVKDGGEQKSEAYSRLNPTQLVPTLVDDDEDIILNQSLSIIEYLDEKYEQGCKLLPEHTLDRARVRSVAYDLACDVQPITNLRILNKLKGDFEADATYIESWQQLWMSKTFSALEKKLATRAGKFCFGYDVSLADICLIPQIYNAKRFNLDMKQFPLISKINENCNSLDAFIKALPENQIDAN